MSNYPIGIDVSKYNIGWSPDKANKPINFVIQRASWACYKDERFDKILPEVQKVPIRGAYHYYSSGVPWTRQAAVFLNAVKDKGFQFFVLDYETAFNSLGRRTIAEASEFIKFVKTQTGKRCLFYFSPSTFTSYISPFGYTNWCNKQDVWLAWYPWAIGQTPLVSEPVLPRGLSHWDIWQYGAGDVYLKTKTKTLFTAGWSAGADYGGGLRGMDLNYFHGTKDDLKGWVNG